MIAKNSKLTTSFTGEPADHGSVDLATQLWQRLKDYLVDPGVRPIAEDDEACAHIIRGHLADLHVQLDHLRRENGRLADALAETKEAVIRTYQNNTDAYDARDKAEAEVQRLTHARDWQPIETAPTYRNILVGGGGCGVCEIQFAKHGEWRGWMKPPTHWMPLPNPPVEARDAVKEQP